MKKVFLIRHAESHGNIGKIYLKSQFIPISKNGKKQAEELKEKLEKPNRIIISKFIRTIETAEPVIKKYPKSEVYLWPDAHEFTYIDVKKLPEMNLDNLNKRIFWYWSKNDPEYRDGTDKETFREFADRVRNLIVKLQKLDKITCVFTHGYVILLCKIYFKKYNDWSKIKKTKGEDKFYKELMREFINFDNNKSESMTFNCEILNITKNIGKFNG